MSEASNEQTELTPAKAEPSHSPSLEPAESDGAPTRALPEPDPARSLSDTDSSSPAATRPPAIDPRNRP